MIDPDLSIGDRIRAIVEVEIDEAETETDQDRAYLDAFRAALVKPFLTTVSFSGGITQKCWTITRTDGSYRVIYMPLAGYFSLCVESDFGPLDVGVHGSAMGCFASV